MNLLDEIKDKNSAFSKNQKRIAAFIYNNIDEAAFMTAANLGKAVNVSESSVVRFAAAVGFKGYPELQEQMVYTVKNKLKQINKLDIQKNYTHSNILDFVLRSDSDKILNTLENADSDTFETAISLINHASKVYVVGIREAAALADLFAFYLRLIVDNVVAVTTSSSSEIFEQMINVNENDVVIGISFPRYSMRTLKAMEFANSRNANVIAITDGIHSPMNLYSSCNLFAGTDMATVVDSMVAPMSLINAIIVALCADNSEKVAKRLETLHDIWDDYRVTNNDEINYLENDIIKDLKEIKR